MKLLILTNYELGTEAVVVPSTALVVVVSEDKAVVGADVVPGTVLSLAVVVNTDVVETVVVSTKRLYHNSRMFSEAICTLSDHSKYATLRKTSN